MLATSWVDQFIETLKSSELQELDWEVFTGIKRVIQRVDKVGSSEAEKAYSCQMLQKLNLGGRSDPNMAGPKKHRTNKHGQIGYYMAQLKKRNIR